MNEPTHLQVGKKYTKVWGSTQVLFRNDSVEVHLIHGKKGGFSSRHNHTHRVNVFYVLSGIINVIVYRENNLDITTLNCGESTEVNCLVDHRFEVVQDCVALEVYYLNPIDSMDIVRKDVGGIGD